MELKTGQLVTVREEDVEKVIGLFRTYCRLSRKISFSTNTLFKIVSNAPDAFSNIAITPVEDIINWQGKKYVYVLPRRLVPVDMTMVFLDSRNIEID